MTETPSSTESLFDIVNGIKAKKIMLPEFQRDFRWELEQTHDLFDSLIRGIFVGTVIYGKPAFAMTLREMDSRPRKGKGSNAPLITRDLTKEQITQLGQIESLRIVLDGQQRLTSIYRAITGIDPVFVILHQGLNVEDLPNLSLEDMVDSIASEESSEAISVRLSFAYDKEINNYEDDDLNQLFQQTIYAKNKLKDTSQDLSKDAKIYRKAVNRLFELYRQEKMLSYYLLDMSLDKFCTFFERSNSRGIQLNFTDILAAKLYHGFNLRRKIDEFESEYKIKLNREIIVRAIAYITGSMSGGTISIDKSYILEKLDADDFKEYWDSTCKLYVDSIQYLINQHYILSQGWMPSENMIIPLMVFLRQIKSFDQMTENHRKFIEYWYWASIFANRYSGSSNEVIILDCKVLTKVATGEKITERNYFTKTRSLIQAADDLFSYTKKGSATYRGILNLLGYEAKGLYDWNSRNKIDPSMNLEDHHIYPRAYINGEPELEGIELSEAIQLVDCVVNRTLIPKILNIKIGKKPPQTYLFELQKITNPQLDTCLASHLLPQDMVKDATWNSCFKLFLDERASAIFSLIDKYVIEPQDEIIPRFAATTENEADSSALSQKPRLRDMLAAGKVQVGDEVFVRKQPEKLAKIISGELVEYEGEQISINLWGQKMTGWSSISIYESVILKRTGQPLRSLR